MESDCSLTYFERIEITTFESELLLMIVGEISKIVPSLLAFDILFKPNYLSETTNHQM